MAKDQVPTPIATSMAPRAPAPAGDHDHNSAIRSIERALVDAEQRRYRCRVAFDVAEARYNDLMTALDVLRKLTST